MFGPWPEGDERRNHPAERQDVLRQEQQHGGAPRLVPVSTGISSARCMSRWPLWTPTVGVRRRRCTAASAFSGTAPRRRAGASSAAAAHGILIAEIRRLDKRLEQARTRITARVEAAETSCCAYEESAI